MKIRILRNTVVNAAVVNVGDVVDALEKDALYLIQLGKAAPFVASPEIENADAVQVNVETTAVKPTKKSKK